MAAVSPVTRAEDITPAGHEYNMKAIASVAVVAGDLLKFDPAGTGRIPSVILCPVNSVAVDGVDAIALHDAAAGQMVSISQEGEITGFTGLTPGTPLYRSGAVAGGIDDTAITTSVTDSDGVHTTPIPAPVQMRVITPTTIRYRFL